MNSFNRLYFEQQKKLPNFFGYAKEVAWNEKLLEKLAQSYDFSIEELDEALKTYAEDTLQIDSYLQYKNCYKCFLYFLTRGKKTEEEKESAYIYYEKYAFAFEKIKFVNFVKEIFEKYKKKVVANENASDYLKEFSINLYDLYHLISIVPELSIYQNIIVSQAKLYYDLCSSVHFDDQEIERLALQYHLSSLQFLTLANLYSTKILHFDLFKQSYLFPKNHYSNKSYEVLDTLVNEEDSEKIQKAILDANIVQQNISVFCYCYHSEMELKDQQALEKKLLRHLRIVQQRKLDIAGQIHHLNATPYEPFSQEYIKSSLDLDEYLKQKGITRSTFLARLRKSSDSDLVLKVREKINQEKINSLDYVAEYCKEIVSYLIHGYPNKETVRKFTLFDYFTLYPDLRLQDININKLSLTSEEKKVLNKFLAPLRANVTMPKEKVLQLKLEFHSEKDKDGFPIKGTGIVVTEEELDLIVNYLTSHNIPLVNSIVNIAAREYVDGNLVIDTLQKR